MSTEDMSLVKNKVKMRVHNGVWVTSVVHMGIELISSATDVRVSLRGLQESIRYLEINLYRIIIRDGV